MQPAVARNLERIRERMAGAARRAGREPGSIALVGVSKTVPVETIREAVEAGLADLGENRVQEAHGKVSLLPEGVRWHLVGHLQSNKARLAARLFRTVHSVDSARILKRLDEAAGQEGKAIDALVQVDLAGEETKFGVPEAGLSEVLDAAGGCRRVTVRGLMVMPPYDPDPEKARPYFSRLRRLLEESRRRHAALPLEELSMGMTEDFEVAIEEGATMVRIGRALFGPRSGT